MADCLIIGCRLVLLGEGKSVHGDLHRSGSALIFNAVLDAKGEAAWEYNSDKLVMAVPQNRVAIPASFPYFERRGIIVFDKWNATFNAAATEYVGKWSKL